mmetsp:Transcript_23917/g.43855  ORF Transcript_23917/g.43855 Transcript_23917/m.43855 type:complete len:220 (-) Transcript_23917:1639-2298(-)
MWCYLILSLYCLLVWPRFFQRFKVSDAAFRTLRTGSCTSFTNLSTSFTTTLGFVLVVSDAAAARRTFQDTSPSNSRIAESALSESGLAFSTQTSARAVSSRTCRSSSLSAKTQSSEVTELHTFWLKAYESTGFHVSAKAAAAASRTSRVPPVSKDLNAATAAIWTWLSSSSKSATTLRVCAAAAAPSTPPSAASSPMNCRAASCTLGTSSDSRMPTLAM